MKTSNSALPPAAFLTQHRRTKAVPLATISYHQQYVGTRTVCRLSSAGPARPLPYELGNLVNLLASSIMVKDKGISSDIRLVDIHSTVDELIKHFQYRAKQQNIEII